MAAADTPLTRRAQRALAEAEVPPGARDLTAAIEHERRAEIDRLWVRTAEPAAPRTHAPHSVEGRQIRRLWALITKNAGSSIHLDSRGHQLLANLAANTPRLWRKHLPYIYVSRADSPDLDARLDELAEVFGLTVRIVRERRTADDAAGARAATLDALRVLAEAYLLIGNSPGSKAELCERTGALNLILGALSTGVGLPSFVIACASGSAVGIAGAAVLGAVAIPTTYAGFANVDRQFSATAPPLMVLPGYHPRHREKVGARARRSFWLMTRLHAEDRDQLEPLPWENTEADAIARTMSELEPSLGVSTTDEFCDRLLAPAGDVVPRPAPLRPGVFFTDED